MTSNGQFLSHFDKKVDPGITCRTRSCAWIFTLLIASVLAGCGSNSATPADVADFTPTLVLTVTQPSPTATYTPAPTATPTGTATVTPTPLAISVSPLAESSPDSQRAVEPESEDISTLTLFSDTTQIAALLQSAITVRSPLTGPVPAPISPPGLRSLISPDATEIVPDEPLAGILPTVTPTAVEALPIDPTETAPADQPTPTAPPIAAPPTSPSMQPTPDGIARTAKIPILMYHYLSVPPADADIYRLDLSVTPDQFASHLDGLQANGYTTITLYDLVAHLTNGAPLPEKPVILTFDDGYRDNYENAFRPLADRGMTATFFIVTDFIDNQRPEYVTWDMAREMAAAGMSMESHSRDHSSLKDRDDDFLVWHALGTAETIEAELGVRPRFISYPAGQYDQRTTDIFHSAHYWAGVTTVQGAEHSNDNLFELRRVRIRGTTTTEELLRLLTVDW